MPRRIVLISDLQQGSRLDALGDFEWPSDVELDLKTVADNGSNAGLHWLAELVEAEPAEAARDLRVRVSNDAGSRRSRSSWSGSTTKARGPGKPIDVYVPPGESRVVRVPRPPRAAPHRSLRLKGDTHDVRQHALSSPTRRQGMATVLYLGSDDPRRSRRACSITSSASSTTRPGGSVNDRASARRKRSPGDSSPAAVRWSSWRPRPRPGMSRRLREYVRGRRDRAGRASRRPGRRETLATLADVAAWDVEEATVGRDVMLGEIAFDHPLFAPLAAPQFNDFTKIHFWKYRRIEPESLGEARVLARFENGDPAVIEKTLGKGRLVIMTSGWSPADSQLARSSKFVPLMSGLLEGRNAGRWTPRITWFTTACRCRGIDGAVSLTVHKPDGTTVTIPRDRDVFAETDQPGVYTIDTAGGARDRSP